MAARCRGAECSIACRRSARACSSCVCTQTQHHSLSSRMSSLAAYARRASAHAMMLHTRGLRRWIANFEHASPALGLCLSKIGQAGQPGIVTHGRGLGRSGARGAGRGALISPRGAVRGVLVSTPQRPCLPCTERVSAMPSPATRPAPAALAASPVAFTAAATAG